MRAPAVVIALLWAAAAGAGTVPASGFDAATLPAAFGPPAADEATIVANVAERLPPDLSVASRDGVIVATPGAIETATAEAKRIARLDGMMRRRAFPNLVTRPVIVVMTEDAAALRELAEALYPAVSGRPIPAGGFYHPQDRLIMTSAAGGDGALVRELTRAHLRDDNPKAPQWLEQAMVTLYESSEVRGRRLVPLLDRRMESIPPNEDLSYDVFAGICDCSLVSGEQIALMRLLLVYLDGRGGLPELLAAIASRGQYTTLLQALDAMAFDAGAWKTFAERSVREYAR